MILNQTFGWIWILFGLLAGLGLGLRFHDEAWLGGYASFRRRMLRLGHVSFIGLGILNLLFAPVAARLGLDGPRLTTASVALVVGGVSMPACCALMAWRPALRLLFAVPVASLLLGVGSLVLRLIRP